MNDDIDALLEEILVDAYGDSEQLTSFEQAFQESARFPFAAQVVGTRVEVVKVKFDGDERHGLTAVCKRDADRYSVSLQDVVPGPVPIETATLLAAYRRWLGLAPLEIASEPSTAELWTYRPVASTPHRLEHPLALHSMGPWDPNDQYWGEPDQEIHPLYQAIIAAGPRPEFEMEQVIPGSDPDDWDSDPITEAAELRRAGQTREATEILRMTIELDERCIDAWVHLGNIAFDSKGPKAALELYDTAAAIGERSLPEGFNGVLPRGLVDNRPFHRALHGLGLCAWRQRRWEDAEAIFTNLLWIDGAQTWTALECLLAVRRRQRWTAD
jgi:tetratricopeptide (TPR) repeat protein